MSLRINLCFPFFLCLMFCVSTPALDFSTTLRAKDFDRVIYFDIQGLRLNMRLDEVKKKYETKNIKVSKDRFGLAKGYEMVEEEAEMKVILNFTGQERLYRIDYSNVYRSYKNRSRELFDKIRQKYGEPVIYNANDASGITKSIHACWGESCTQYNPITPTLKASVYYSTGRIKLVLSDYRIFNDDWKKYKQEFNSIKNGRPPQKETTKALDF